LILRNALNVPYAAPYAMPNPARYSAATSTGQLEDGHTGTPESTPRRSTRPKLSDDDVREIRADYATGQWTQKDLADIYGVSTGTIFGVSTGTIFGVVSRNTYWHVPDLPEPEPIEHPYPQED
jgi:hypothetical protein